MGSLKIISTMRNSLLIAMVNPKLDPLDQDRQIIGPDLNPNNLPTNLTL